MPAPTLVVLVTGPPATGKTTLSRALSERFGLPRFAKDDFKERMYNAAFDGDDAWLTPELSRRLGRCAMECLEVALEACVRAAAPAVFDAPIAARVFSSRLARLRERHAVHVVQAALRCRGDVLLDRYLARARAVRHPVHGGEQLHAALEIALRRGEDDPLTLQADDDVIAIDTTDLAAVDTGPLVACIARRLAARSPQRLEP